MNNRKPRNKRGKITREKFLQEIPEAREITVNKKKVANPDYPGKRFVTHHLVPKVPQKLWGKDLS